MKTNPDLPYGARDHESRQQLARELGMKIDAYRDSTTGMRDRWAVNEAYYRNQPETSEFARSNAVMDANGNVTGETTNRLRTVQEWQATEHHPVVQPIIDAFVAQQYNAITLNSEYVTGETYGQSKEMGADVGKTIQHFFEVGGFDDALDELLLISGLAGVAFLRMSLTVDVDGLLSTRSNPDISRSGPIRYAGLVFDVIHPRDVAVYPINAPNIEACSLIAHRVQMMRRAEIEELQLAGRYLSKDEVGGLVVTQDPDPDESAASALFSRGMDDTINATEDGDEQIEVWTGLAKLKLDKDAEFEKWHEFILAKDSFEILQLREYEPPKPWYFAFYVKREPGRLIPRSSPAQDLQAIQRIQSELYNQFIDAAYAATLPAYVAEEGAFLEKTISLIPGSVTEVSGLTKDTVMPFPVNANQGAALNALQYNTELAQTVARVSSNSMGNNIPGGTTATEASIIQAGNSANANYALRVFSRGLVEAWGFAQLLIAQEFALLKEHYGDAIPVPDMYEDTGMTGEQAMMWPIRWRVTGKEINTNPGYTMQTLLTLLGVAGQMEQMGDPVFDIAAIAEAAANASGLTDAYNVLLSSEERDAKRAEMQRMAQLQLVAGMAGGGGSPGAQG